jgi:transposase
MPNKINDDRRHKFKKMRYRVTNWPQYDAALVRRGDLTVWLTEEAVTAWRAPKRAGRGGQRVYSDLAIETGLALRLVLRLALRQTEGALRSIAGLLGAAIMVPDHTTFSRRSARLTILPQTVKRDEPIHLLIDSTGLKIYGEGEWLDQKHGVRARRRWRKLHIAVDADTHEVRACALTPDDVGDVTAVPDLLDQVKDQVAAVIADGAYDGQPVYDAVAANHPGAAIVIPPRSTAVAGQNENPTQRDRHLEAIAKHGRRGWQQQSGYGRRSLVETAMFRYKTIIGRRLHARTLSNQKTEARIACNVLNRMTSLGMPVSVRVK